MPFADVRYWHEADAECLSMMRPLDGTKRTA